MPKDIATAAKVTPQAVSYFLSAAKAAELVEYDPRDPPRRILDYVPPAWLELIELQKVVGERSEAQSSVEKISPQGTRGGTEVNPQTILPAEASSE